MAAKPRQLYFGTAQLAARYGLTVGAVIKWIVRGRTLAGVTRRLAARKVGGTWRVHRRDWRAWLDWCGGGDEPAAPAPTPSRAERRARADVERARALVRGRKPK